MRIQGWMITSQTIYMVNLSGEAINEQEAQVTTTNGQGPIQEEMSTSYLPSLRQVSQEAIAVLAAALIAALVISRFPAVKQFVRENSVS